ncbi:extracellular triacylglycerol lipase precursor [Amanita muscaria]
MKRGILFYVFALIQFSPSFAAPQVRLGDTTVTGQEIPSLQQDFFGGIPFAESPVGNFRLKPPVLKTTLDVKEFNASSFGYACVQPPPFPAELMAEDCLTINIFRPSGIGPDSKLPVLFWTYGGGFQSGASRLYNGSSIVAQSMARGTPIVFVNFNYRLGPLGFPQGSEADQRHSLNLGLYDQIAALEWVKHNIASFGGDNEKVTAFGESAGSIMTSILFLNYRIEGLARAGIFESGHAMTLGVFHPERGEIDWQNFVRGVPSCSSLATTGNTFSCLQAANSSDIIQGLLVSITESPEMFPWPPVLDGPNGVVPDYASRRFLRGEFARLPFIAGTNLDEGTIFEVNSPVTSEDGLAQTITANYSPPAVSPQTLQSHIQMLLQLYPDIPALGSPYNTGNNTFGLSSVYKQNAAIFGDLAFQSQRRPAVIGVFHSLELLALFRNLAGLLPFTVGPISANLSTVMMDYWISFATSLDPNDGHGTPRPIWEPYTCENQASPSSTQELALLQLNSQNLSMIPDDYRKEQIEFINSDPIVWLH